MKVTIKSIHFDADAKLLDHVQLKVNKLEQFSENIICADVVLRVDKPQHNDNKIGEVRLQIPGNDLFAKKQADTFELAIDGAVEALRKQLIKRKGKLSD